VEELLEIKNLKTAFRIDGGDYAAVDDVSLQLHKGEVLGIVGESGSGKSALAFSIMGLHQHAKVEGKILFQNKNMVEIPSAKINRLRGNKLAMIFQDPLSSLNPLMKIGEQIAEMFVLHQPKMRKRQRQMKVNKLLETAGIARPERVAGQYPHELSGGMRQRVMIAMAVANQPQLLIADEPTTALDVTIQSQILGLMQSLREDSNTGVILITHDLGVVAEMADRVAVMYAGEIVEICDVFTLFEEPLHPYSRSLLKSMPQGDEKRLHVIEGVVPTLKNLPRSGCRFAERIPWIGATSHESHPELHEVTPNHFVRCTCYRDFYFPDE